MNLVLWGECNRTLLRELLPEALVLLATGATEQHGPHLATGTDILVSSTLVERAARAAGATAARPIVIAPPLPFGASDHHLTFGGTISFSVSTMLSALGDVLNSMAASGARRVVIVNGHGGNTGVVHAAAAAATAGRELRVAHIDYWTLLAGSPDAGADVPGHAGRFESAVVAALRPELVGDPPSRPEPPATPAVAGAGIHAADDWRAIDGFSDDPRRSLDTDGAHLVSRLVDELAARILALSEIP